MTEEQGKTQDDGRAGQKAERKMTEEQVKRQNANRKSEIPRTTLLDHCRAVSFRAQRGISLWFVPSQKPRAGFLAALGMTEVWLSG